MLAASAYSMRAAATARPTTIQSTHQLYYLERAASWAQGAPVKVGMRLLNGGPDRGGVALLRRALALQVHVRAAHQLGACMRMLKTA